LERVEVWVWVCEREGEWEWVCEREWVLGVVSVYEVWVQVYEVRV